MKQIFLIINSLFTLVGCSRFVEVKPAINGLSSNHISQAEMDSIYQQAKNFPNNTQLSIALINGDNVRYVGVKRLEDTLIFVDNSGGVFEIGSITKVMTSTILADLIAKKQVRGEDSIGTYFDFPFNDNLDFTFVSLANHTSGLPRLPSNMFWLALMSSSDPYKKYDREKLNSYLTKKVSIDHPVGYKIEYSNLGAGLLAYALQNTTGKTFEQLIGEVISEMYKMPNTTTDQKLISDKLIGGLNDRGDPTPNWSSGVLIGAGGVYSSVEDLAKFALAHFDSTNTTLSISRKKTFQDNEDRDVGMGWFILKKKDGAKWYWHNGGTGGYTSSMAMDVEGKKAVIVLSNISAYHKNFRNIDNLCFGLMGEKQD
ncbi:MAG: beta-lactamase family protein [Cryomorphaceae bacterium]|nr:beta-lactamase family protein [Cryomorphaceae bacterium]